MAELIPSHVQKVFARVYHESRTVSPTQLVVAVESHAGAWSPRNLPISSHAGAKAAWFLGEVGVLSVLPARSYCAKLYGAIPSDITWGAGAFFCSAPAAPSAQGTQPGSSWCWRGGSSEGSGSSRSTSCLLYTSPSPRDGLLSRMPSSA